MIIVVKDKENGKIYSKYQLSSLDFADEAIKDGDYITLMVVPNMSLEQLQEDFNKAGMR